VVSAAGAVTALGDTLFPSNTLAEGVARDFSPTAHFLERLRVWHPLLAVLTALYLFTTLGLVQAQRGDERTRRLVRVVQLLLVAQLAAGAVNLILLAPVFMQLLHLLLADAVWLALVFLGASALETSPEPVAEGKMRLSGAG
ncbi:MAG: COX15/CtaA family protein, partial [Chloroflexota bacterium]